MENGQRWANVQKACKEKVNNAVRMKTPALVLVVHHPAPPAHTFSRTLGESPSRTRCREGTTVTEDAVRSAPVRPPAPPVSYAAACRTAPCRPKATDLLTSALPHHQAPGALTPGWPYVAALTRVVSNRRGTPLPGRYVLSRSAWTQSSVCAHCLIYKPFAHPCRDVTASWGVHQFRGITLAETRR